MQKISTEKLKREIIQYKSLDIAAKEKYVKAALETRSNVESRIDELFATDTELRDIIKEQFRDFFHQSSGLFDDVESIPCSIKITYDDASMILDMLVSTNDDDTAREKIITYRKNKYKKIDKKIRDSDFMQFMRGYAKYFRNLIDENEMEDQEIGEVWSIWLEAI